MFVSLFVRLSFASFFLVLFSSYVSRFSVCLSTYQLVCLFVYLLVCVYLSVYFLSLSTINTICLTFHNDTSLSLSFSLSLSRITFLPPLPPSLLSPAPSLPTYLLPSFLPSFPSSLSLRLRYLRSSTLSVNSLVNA